MLDALTITEAKAAGPSELAALDLAMARDFAARARVAQDPDTANALARTYQRMGRSYRQSLALKAWLAREIAQADREPPPPAPRDEARIEARIAEVRRPVRRVIWAEHEPAEAADPLDDLSAEVFELLDARLDILARDNRFGLEPLDAHVVSLCRSLGLDVSLARGWRDLPDPP